MLLIPRRDVILANDRGRFQDTDESAHYEFLCKAAGVPVHYCAESFANDGTLSSLLMKTLKRGMAAEYSRELSAKVLAGQKRLACLGFKQGGVPGYGLRRMLVASDGTLNSCWQMESAKASPRIESRWFTVPSIFDPSLVFHAALLIAPRRIAELRLKTPVRTETDQPLRLFP